MSVRNSVARDRRRFLKALGMGPLGLAGAGTFMRALPAWAAEEKRYLILLFSPNGVVRHLWGADSTGQGASDFTLRPWLAPLTPYKQHVAVVTGLQNKVASAVGGTHEGGMSTLWSGGRAGATPQQPAGETIDQAVARHLMTNVNVGTRYASLEFRARAPEDYMGKTIENRMIYSGPGASIDPREDPMAARDQLFLGIGKGGGSETPTIDPAERRKLAVRKKLLERLTSDLDQAAPKLCTEDKRHLDALRDGWKTLQARLGGNDGPVSAACAQPAVAGEKAFPKATRDMFEVLVMSLACDLTRVASLQMSQARSPAVGSWLGHSTDHHSISHEAPQPFTLGPKAPQDTDAENPTPAQLEQFKTPIRQMTEFNVFYAEEVAYLCKRLSQFPVEGGKTLLDQTLIVWGNELDNGSNHDHVNMPFVLIGSGGGKIKTNQVVRYPVLNSYMAQGTAMRQHNDLLVTIGKAFGLSIDKFGDPAYSKGVLTELLA